MYSGQQHYRFAELQMNCRTRKQQPGCADQQIATADCARKKFHSKRLNTARLWCYSKL
jgi:hypothetical protein